MSRKEWRWVVGVILALVVVSSLHYLLAWANVPSGMHFTGLIFNPQDGNSYIAKMRQGLQGSWLFRLPYTPEPQAGAPVYLFYLFLGHVARWTGLSLILLYHAVRVIGGAAMLAMLYVLAAFVSDDVGERRAMFLLAALGSGLGWLVVFFGYQSADLWVPEAFPIYALLTNAHFPLAIGLMVCVAICGLQVAKRKARRVWPVGLGMVLAGVALGVVQPFGLVAVFGGLGAVLLVQVVHERVVPWRAVAWIVLAGLLALPYPLYMVGAMRNDPALAAWNAQNVTDSPPLWDWALSYGVILALALPGARAAVRRGTGADWVLLGWAGLTFVGMYLPLPLQRRLSLGLGVPLGGLAGMGWWRVVRLWVGPRRRGLVQGLLIALCALTPLFVIVGHLAVSSDAYLDGREWAALMWLRDQADPEGVVLCSSHLGLFVPAWAGQPVIYGHPFETIDAEKRQALVDAFWSGEMDAAERAAFLEANRVRYVLVEPEVTDWQPEGEKLVFETGGVSVYDVETE
jgi:hypothetical protein